MNYIDIRSDTVTHPTPKMRKAMSQALVGDDVFNQDPTAIELQKLAAEILGKQSSIYVPTGTMGNLLAVMIVCSQGDEIIAARGSHIVQNETGSIGGLLGVQIRCLQSQTGKIYAQQGIFQQQVKKNNLIRKKTFLYPSTKMICIENSLSNGRIYQIQQLRKIKELADEKGIRVHMDGARIFHAAASLGVNPKEIAQYAHSITFCLSKGLCCPIGSLLVGQSSFIEQAYFCRKSIGGGMRQVGILCAAGLVGLRQMVQPIKQDIKVTKQLAQDLQKLKGVTVYRDRCQCNMIFCRIQGKGDLVKWMDSCGIKMNLSRGGQYRIMVHFYIRQKQRKCIVQNIKKYLSQK